MGAHHAEPHPSRLVFHLLFPGVLWCPFLSQDTSRIQCDRHRVPAPPWAPLGCDGFLDFLFLVTVAVLGSPGPFQRTPLSWEVSGVFSRGSLWLGVPGRKTPEDRRPPCRRCLGTCVSRTGCSLPTAPSPPPLPMSAAHLPLPPQPGFWTLVRGLGSGLGSGCWICRWACLWGLPCCGFGGCCETIQPLKGCGRTDDSKRLQEAQGPGGLYRGFFPSDSGRVL